MKVDAKNNPVSIEEIKLWLKKKKTPLIQIASLEIISNI